MRPRWLKRTGGRRSRVAAGRVRRGSALGIVFGVVLSFSCGDSPTDTGPPHPPPPAPVPTTVSVTPSTAELSVLGATVQLAAEVRDQAGHAMPGAPVSWASGDESVATVDASGLVTAVANGTTTVTATAGSASGTAMVTVARTERARWTLSGTVSHGWADPESGPSVMNDGGRVVGAVVEVVDGPDAGRQTTTDDHGHYLLESLEEAPFAVHATAEGFASVDQTLVLTSDTALAFAISRKLPPPGPPVSFPDTDPDWLRTLSSDYPYAHQVANVRVFSDIIPAYSVEHAEHLSRVWGFFDALYAENRGEHVDAYYTADSTVFKKVVPHCPTTFIPGARNVTGCYLDYPRWFIMPYQIPDFGTQLHEIGHDFLFATWPGAWRTSNWFVEGTAMYYEAGAFTDEGSLRVPVPFSWCTSLFQEHDRQDRLMPLGELLRLSRDDFLAANWRTYSQSCMLFDYLERHEPGVLYALIHRINAGLITSNDELIAALIELTGKSVSALEEAYESYARIAGEG